MQIAVLGIDLGKNSCSIVGLDGGGAVVLRRRMRREGVIKLADKLKPCVAAMEACCGAHHLGRVLRALGHDVRLMSPEYVRPYVKSQKNDDRDAEAIAEAATRPTMRFVELKAEEQLDMQTLHRARDRLVGERTALINQLRAILLERGIAVAQGRRQLERYLAGLNALEGLSQRMRMPIEDMRQQWCELDRRIAELDSRTCKDLSWSMLNARQHCASLTRGCRDCCISCCCLFLSRAHSLTAICASILLHCSG
jgi:transposase